MKAETVAKRLTKATIRRLGNDQLFPANATGGSGPGDIFVGALEELEGFPNEDVNGTVLEINEESIAVLEFLDNFLDGEHGRLMGRYVALLYLEVLDHVRSNISKRSPLEPSTAHERWTEQQHNSPLRPVQVV